MVPLLFGMIFYNVSINFFMQENPQEIEDVANLHFLFNLQIKDFGLINKLCWLLMYYLIFAFLYFKHKVSLHQSLLSALSPTLLFLLFSYMIKSFATTWGRKNSLVGEQIFPSWENVTNLWDKLRISGRYITDISLKACYRVFSKGIKWETGKMGIGVVLVLNGESW